MKLIRLTTNRAHSCLDFVGNFLTPEFFYPCHCLVFLLGDFLALGDAFIVFPPFLFRLLYCQNDLSFLLLLLNNIFVHYEHIGQNIFL